jgi:hypothetical protein
METGINRFIQQNPRNLFEAMTSILHSSTSLFLSEQLFLPGQGSSHCQVSVCPKYDVLTNYSTSSIKSKSVQSCRNRLRLLLKVHCITFYSFSVIQYYVDPTLPASSTPSFEIKHGNLYRIALINKCSIRI